MEGDQLRAVATKYRREASGLNLGDEDAEKLTDAGSGRIHSGLDVSMSRKIQNSMEQ